MIGDRQRPSAADGSFSSFIVTHKSLSIRDRIVFRESQIKNRTIKKVLAVDRLGKIFVREFLPAAVYGLLRRTKIVAARRGYKPFWVRSGEVCVRRLDGSNIVLSRSDLNLEKLE